MAWGFWLVLLAPCRAEPPAKVDYLVLKNGSILTGRVVQDGQTYILRSLTSSGESRYPAKMVAKVCADAHEVYELFKQAITPDDSDDHCRLASLCLQHGMMKEARAEIEEALKIDRHSKEAITLLKQWNTKQAMAVNVPQTVPALPSAAILPITPVSLDEWPIVMNPQVFGDFNQRIQPMLMTGCGTGACHGVPEGKRAFTLKKGLVGVPPSLPMTRTNLERVLALVDKQNPDASDLLKKAVQQHGHIKVWPVSTEQQAALRQWVYYVTGKLEVARQEPAKVDGNAVVSKGAAGEFASNHGGVQPSVVDKSVKGMPSSKLPMIPGMSGGAIQQTGAEERVTNGGTPPQADPVQPPPVSSNGLPVIPGVSGKAQNGNGSMPQTPPPTKQEQVPPPPRTKLDVNENPLMLDYARRMGLSPTIPAPKQDVPQQLLLVNAGTYRVETPPVPELPEEIRDQLKRQEAAKKNESKDKDAASSVPGFMRMGTVVNSPPR